MNDALLKKSSTTVVMDAVNELNAMEQHVTRETLAATTGLKMSVIDDRIKVLANEEKIHRIRDGLYTPVKQFPPSRPISKTVLPDGMVKIEIGDDVLTLTPREDRTLAGLQSAAAMQLAMVETGHQAAVLSSEMAQRNRQMEREIAGMHERHRDLTIDLTQRIKRLRREMAALRAKHNDAQLQLVGVEPVAMLGGLKT